MKLRTSVMLWKGYLKRIDSYADDYTETKKIPTLSPGQSRFYDNVVFPYLGKRVSTIICEDGERYDDIKDINMITRIFTTKDGKMIPLTSISGGQSQSMQICGTLNDEEDKRKMIVLSDDISNIAGMAFDVVKEKIKESEEKGRLLFSILVQAREGDLKISEF